GLVLEGALLTPYQGAANPPLALPVQDIANGVSTGGATVARLIAGGGHGRVVAARPIAEGTGEKNPPRDHAASEVLVPEPLGMPPWSAGGARVRRGRGVPWPQESGDAWPGAAPLASGGAGADIRARGSSADSSARAGTCGHTPCGSRSAVAV